MQRSPRSPLLLAVALALVPLAALAVALGPLHHGTPAPRAQATPRPTAAPLPGLVAGDAFDLGAPRAFGRVDVTGIDHHGDVAITGYTLATSPQGLPTAAAVWKLRGFVDVPTTALQARLGVSPPTPEFPGDKFDGLIDLSQGRVSAVGSAGAPVVDAGLHPTEASSAVSAVTLLLSDLGLAPRHAAPAVHSIVDGPGLAWEVSFRREPIEGIPVGLGDDAVARVDITAGGDVTRLVVDDPAVGGGSVYPLRSWQEAWADVTAGHWFTACCATFDAGPVHLAFRAGAVTLADVQVDAPAMLLVPMYVFTDTAQRLSLAVPALTAADLSEPGGFRLTEPGAQ